MGAPAPFNHVHMQRVEQISADASASSVSLRSLSIDLRTPIGFRDLFRLRTTPQPGRPPRDMFARQSGGITAVFPQSAYLPAKTNGAPGFLVEIPPGTVFYIGPLPTHLFEPATDNPPPSLSRLDTRAHTATPTDATESSYTPRVQTTNFHPGPTPPPSEPPPSVGGAPPPAPPSTRTLAHAGESPPPADIFTSDDYRKHHVRRLLTTAARDSRAKH